MKLTHENKVEQFYTHGSDIRGMQEGGYLSFGYWTDPDMNYQQAAEALINHILAPEKPLHRGHILNVACGYGSETVKIYEKLQPEKICAIDITETHIAFAQKRITQMGLSESIIFEKMDACKLCFQPDHFDYVIAIEGPAHFNTREMFFRKSYHVLKQNGVLLLSDIIVDKNVAESTLFNRLVGHFCAKHWFMPRANWMSIEEMRVLLENIGFSVERLEGVGSSVYPGFSHFNLKWSSIKNAVHTRGMRIGLSLTFISWLLGYVHRRKMIDYVFLRAVKK